MFAPSLLLAAAPESRSSNVGSTNARAIATRPAQMSQKSIMRFLFPPRFPEGLLRGAARPPRAVAQQSVRAVVSGNEKVRRGPQAIARMARTRAGTWWDRLADCRE